MKLMIMIHRNDILILQVAEMLEYMTRSGTNMTLQQVYRFIDGLSRQGISIVQWAWPRTLYEAYAAV